MYKRQLDRSGATEEIGAENMHPRVLRAVAMHLNRTAGGASGVLEMSADSLQRLVDVVGAQIPAATGADRERLEALQRRLQDAIETITDS